MELHLNQQSELLKELMALFPNLDSERIWPHLKDLTYAKYKYLLALCYKKKKLLLDVELFKLGVFN